jgi:hypothetical protein
VSSSFNFFLFLVCAGTSSLFSSSHNDYLKWKTLYKDCVYVDGNLELANFHPFYDFSNQKQMFDDEHHEEDEKIDKNYDFSFLDSIREISGYLLIHATRVKNLTFKNLILVRGRSLVANQFSIYIHANIRLERLNLSNLREVQRGKVLISNNPKLCHMNEVNWNDISSNSLIIERNADPLTCKFTLNYTYYMFVILDT